MSRRSLETEYEHLVEEAFARGEIAIRTDGPDQRRAPRFRIRDGRVGVRVEPQFTLVDVAATGIAFLSDISFPPGAVVQLILGRAVAIHARVVCCVLVETDPLLLEWRYRVQCQFDDLANGKQVLVLMKEMERLDALSSFS